MWSSLVMLVFWGYCQTFHNRFHLSGLWPVAFFFFFVSPVTFSVLSLRNDPVSWKSKRPNPQNVCSPRYCPHITKWLISWSGKVDESFQLSHTLLPGSQWPAISSSELKPDISLFGQQSNWAFVGYTSRLLIICCTKHISLHITSMLDTSTPPYLP